MQDNFSIRTKRPLGSHSGIFDYLLSTVFYFGDDRDEKMAGVFIGQ